MTTPSEEKWSEFESDAADRKTRKPECAMCTFLKTLPKEGREAVERTLGRREITTPSIRKELETRVQATIPSTWIMNRHRRGECRES